MKRLDIIYIYYRYSYCLENLPHKRANEIYSFVAPVKYNKKNSDDFQGNHIILYGDFDANVKEYK